MNRATVSKRVITTRKKPPHLLNTHKHAVDIFIEKIKHFIQALQFEIKLSYQFIYRDISYAIIPALIFSLIAVHSIAPFSWGLMLISLLKSSIYFYLFIYLQVLGNQIVGIKEDKINKPDRPLPAGIISVQSAYVRCLVAHVLFIFFAWLYDVVAYALLWQCISLLYDFGKFSRYCISKSLLIGIGVIAQLPAAWLIVAPLTITSWEWIIFIASVSAITISIQDFRDMLGDKKIGRHTLPLILGEKKARKFMAWIFLLMPIAMLSVLNNLNGLTLMAWLYLIVFLLWSLFIAWRLVHDHTPEDNIITYKSYTFWFCYVICAAFFML